ncbi:MAG: CHAT domain-containing protein [Saprospiraceae bacterium]
MLNKTLLVVVAFCFTLNLQAQNWDDLNDQVLTYLGNGDYANALSSALRAREVAKIQFGENHADYSASLHNLASAHKKLGEFTPAEILYWEALKIDKEVLGVKHQNYALSLFGLANLYKLKKDYQKAESIYLDALDIMKAAVSDDHPDYALILSDYADLHTSLGNFKKAENNLKKAKETTRYSVGERHQDYAGILFNYGKFYKNRANVPEAEISLTKALELYKNTVGVNHPDYKDCKRYLDNLYNPKYELYEAAPSEALLPIERPGLASSNSTNSKKKWNSSTEVITGLGNSDGVDEIVEKNNSSAKGPLERSNKKTMPTATAPVEEVVTPPVVEEVITPPVVVEPPKPKVKNWMDYSFEMDSHTQSENYTGAIEAGQKALMLVKEEYGDEHENYRTISLKLADSYENAGMLDRAIPFYEKDLATIEKKMGKDNTTYKKRRDGLLKAYETTGQKSKARDFYKASVYNSFAKFNAAGFQDQSRMMDKMQMEIEDYYANSMKLGFLVSGNEMQNFNLAFKGLSTDAALEIKSSMTGEIESYQNQLREKLKPNEAAIDFLRMTNQKTKVGNYYALITRKNKTESIMVPLLDESKINMLINAEADSPDSYIQSVDRSNHLYQLIWEPMEEHLKGVNFIHVSTVGALNKVAFSGLMDRQKNNLADKYEIYYYCSLRDFINDKSKEVKNETVSFFGGAIFGNGGAGKLEYLPATKDEVNTFKVICAAKGWTVNTQIDGDASENNIKNLSGGKAPGVLHLATPVYYQHLEEFSGIALSNANEKITSTHFQDDANDGLLNAKEISKLDFSKTNLVLLSATETGSNKNSAKGILSIQRALKAAGVNTILFSQWKVPDKQTQEMLSLFYFNHLSGMDTHKAFYTAQKDIRKLYPSPYFWAGFILIE